MTTRYGIVEFTRRWMWKAKGTLVETHSDLEALQERVKPDDARYGVVELRYDDEPGRAIHNMSLDHRGVWIEDAVYTRSAPSLGPRPTSGPASPAQPLAPSPEPSDLYAFRSRINTARKAGEKLDTETLAPEARLSVQLAVNALDQARIHIEMALATTLPESCRDRKD